MSSTTSLSAIEVARLQDELLRTQRALLEVAEFFTAMAYEDRPHELVELLDRALEPMSGDRPTQGQRFYIQDSRTCVGNALVWWSAGGNGYTCDIEMAGLYSAADCRKRRETDIPWRAEYVRAKAGLRLEVNVQDVTFADGVGLRWDDTLHQWVESNGGGA